MEEMFNKRSLDSTIMVKLIDAYRDCPKCKGDDIIFHIIIEGFQGHIEYNIRKILGKDNEEIKGCLVYEISKWINKKNLRNPYGYLYKNIIYYIKNYINRNILYPELTEREIKTYVKLKNKYKERKNIPDNDREKLEEFECRKLETFDYNDELDAISEIEEAPYIFKDIVHNLNQYEQFIIQKYYIEDLTYEEIGNIVGKNRKTIRIHINKTVEKLKKQMGG